MDVALFNALALSFIGGIILNFMPCVFPILSLKVVSVLKRRAEGDSGALQDCASYTAGVLVGMLGLACALLLFRATGRLLGWGFQLQSPTLVAVLMNVTFLVGLSFSGWYEISTKMPMVGYNGSRNLGSFLAGVLSALLGTPCAAPFMVSAISFSILQPGFTSILIFQFIGLGMVFPYLAFSFIPGAKALLPKSGTWMEHLKQFLAFPMYLTSAWLLHVLVSQKGSGVVFPAVCSVVGLVLFVWVLRLVFKSGSAMGAVSLMLTATFVLISSYCIGGIYDGGAMHGQRQVIVADFTIDKLQKLLDSGATVFVSVGAEWCLTCKANELIIASPGVQEVLRSRGVTYVKADWTSMDAEIAKYLSTMGAGSVPYYALYVRGKLVNDHIPQMFSESKLVEILLRNLDDPARALP
ncbi:protein-disulfide reductase DsbD family protein [Candidatus Anaplasma sp. TIGMIC]|uniref:protein-disulfide reductase DsbD family protein n=1 Tax=Candidatus Anaplasma sp. TIGMIC TaxID=3020713 RepID=UPI002330286E|nr:thioredoxin family protein [Candidatus Anaplasma sp. TIGMIC]MDB1135317.1 thioredoxin family protein [Candidatus Anaplasma sp. TIGMIC]